MVLKCRPVWRNGCYEHMVCSVVWVLKWVSRMRKALNIWSRLIYSLSQIWLAKTEIMTSNLNLAYVWIRDNSSHFSYSRELLNGTQRQRSRAIPKVFSLLPMPSMIFILSSHFFLKRAHQSCHPSYQQRHWALMSDTQTFKLKSCFRRELLKFKWAGHIEEENTRLHAHLRIWPSHLDP